MRDGWLRRTVKRMARWRYQTDLAATRWIMARRGEGTPYVLRGTCTGCGACCETPMIHVNRWVYHARVLRWAILTWHRVVNGFEHIASDRGQHAFVFRCTHYDPVTRQCDAYDSRPGMCRDYPRNLLDLPNPEFLPACTHYAFARDAETIRASLRELALPPDKLAELERQFRVAEPSFAPSTSPCADCGRCTDGRHQAE
jgi:Fe-S-cluster containining protein